MDSFLIRGGHRLKGKIEISGSKNSHVVTLVERQSRYTALVKVKNKETATVVAADASASYRTGGCR